MHDEAASSGGEEPVGRYAYRLDWTDALVWETLPFEWRGWRKFAFFLWLALAGIWLAMLPDRLVGSEYSLRWWIAAFVLLAIQYGSLTLAMNLLARRRARRRIRGPVEAMLEEWDDRLRETRGGVQRIVRPKEIVAVPVTPRHVIIHAPPDVVIVPRSAFADEAAAAAFATRWDDLSKNAEQ